MRNLLVDLPDGGTIPVITALRDPFLSAVIALLEANPVTWASVTCNGRDGSAYTYRLAPAVVAPTDVAPDSRRVILGPELRP